MKKLILVLFLFSILILACGSDSGRTFTLLDDSLMAGTYVCMWDQYDGREYVPDGSYAVQMRAGDFEQSVNFRISANNSPVQADCDSSGTTGGGQLPTQFALTLNPSEYAPRDTICIFFDLPTSSDVQILIRER